MKGCNEHLRKHSSRGFERAYEFSKAKPVLVLMARWPAAGRCKKRLSADIGAFTASSIQQVLTSHTLAVAKNLERRGLVKIKLAISGVAYKAAQRWCMHKKIKTFSFQGQGNLGVRMRKQVLEVQNQYKPRYKTSRTTILIGTDLPDLSHVEIMQAIKALENHELVIGPARDGGYWLLGLSGGLLNPVASWPFSEIPWGTSEVLNETIKKAELAGINYNLIQEKNDLDDITDLDPWKA